MMHTAVRSAPRLRDVVAEQIRTVGLTLRLPAVVAAALFALATPLVAFAILRHGEVVDFQPEQWILPGMAGLLLPIGVWRRETPFAGGFLWTLPVDRRRHALVRVVAGWVWLMAGVALFVLWLLALALFSGGSILEGEVIRYVPSLAERPGTIDPASVQAVHREPEPLLWLAPFTGATAAYLLASALALGLRHPLRWIAGTIPAFVLIHGIGVVVDAEWLAYAPGHLRTWLLYGPYGLDTVLVAGTDALTTDVTLSTGAYVQVWRGHPDSGGWALATLLWLGAGGAALWLALSRHRERPPG